METMDQKSTLPIQVSVRPLVFSDASLINNPGINKNQFMEIPEDVIGTGQNGTCTLATQPAAVIRLRPVAQCE